MFIYKARVTREDNHNKEMYTGLTYRRFKDRFHEHTVDIKHVDRDDTCLNDHVWGLKNLKVPFSITWEILTRRPAFNPSKMACDLVLTEKQ